VRAPDDLRWDSQGLVPAVVQEAETGELLMLAWMDREALARTRETGLAHYWSRSRQARWQKGETSGHRQHVEAIVADCDRDALLLLVHQEGVACHTGSRTCFFQEVSGAAAGRERAGPRVLDVVERVIQARKAEPRPGSYVAGLLAKGEAHICLKIGEEAWEVIEAAVEGEGERRLVEEVADLWFHTMVLLGARGIPLRRVFEELARRHALKAAGSEGSRG
jgi:phosphoribosyl-ATP pyrophosphohydrolase/phosphoribosyl-AMP cyclohydrolase